jgi:hypothetical protein
MEGVCISDRWSLDYEINESCRRSFFFPKMQEKYLSFINNHITYDGLNLVFLNEKAVLLPSGFTTSAEPTEI